MRRVLGSDISADVYRRKEEGNFSLPAREIFSQGDIPIWQETQAYRHYVSFVTSVNEAIQGMKLRDMNRTSEMTDCVVKLLHTMTMWVDEIPPIKQNKTLGNAAFKLWYKKMTGSMPYLLQKLLYQEFWPAIVELSMYLKSSFGEENDVSYGVGHETVFAMFICCLFKIGATHPEELAASVLTIFNKYLVLVRKLISTYRMLPMRNRDARTPIDDYNFLPYLWGSSQLINHATLTPAMSLERTFSGTYCPDYMYFGSMRFIHQMKPGEIVEHSELLWTISGYGSWKKVNDCLLNMYISNVLTKHPIMQISLFGSILPFVRYVSEEEKRVKLRGRLLKLDDALLQISETEPRILELKKRTIDII